MLNWFRQNKPEITVFIILFTLLLLVRVYQEQLFYDPFLNYFKGENYDGKPLPQYDAVQLGLNLLFRYTLNSLLSLGIIWLFFKDKSILKLSSLLYAGFFIILITAFYIVLSANEPNMLVLFYIRRFIIQPLFLILFIPAFYYQNKAQ
jgi:exosortase F-associated protein